jgi:hypothetical protein
LELEASFWDKYIDYKQIWMDDFNPDIVPSIGLTGARERIEDLESIVVQHQVEFVILNAYLETPDGSCILNIRDLSERWLDTILPEPE